MSDKTRQVGRLALRVQGPWWVAYYAMPDTMEGAIELGRIYMGAVRVSDEIADSFKETMKLTLRTFFERHLGADVDHWVEETARDSERSGNA